MRLRSGLHISSQSVSQSTRKRKRSPSETSCDRVADKLTRHNLAKLSRIMEAPRGRKRRQSDIPSARSVSSVSMKSSSTAKSRRTTASNSKILPTLEKHNIETHWAPAGSPDDYNKIQARLSKRRNSPEPESMDWERYRLRLGQPVDCHGEGTVDGTWHNFILHDTTQYFHDTKVLWSGFQGMEIDNRPVTVTPDKADYPRYTANDYHPDDITALGTAIKPAPGRAFGMPHFFSEHKSPTLSPGAAMIQIALDGAVVLQADRLVFERVGQPFPYGETRALSVASNGATIQIHAHFINSNGCYTYKLLRQFSTIISFEDFKNARRAIRNSQQIGRERGAQIAKLLRARLSNVQLRPSEHRTQQPSPISTEGTPLSTQRTSSTTRPRRQRISAKPKE